ncbi:hypothetical protein CEXT_100981 [Caerostris extrusa]|uniref:Uncharacterized protein n=1 Tax=Caerostris extrusa TaxID=172846 RepID=A0AAV4MEX7_CAEEX|nr:hypothetical protein CEXT_100981 [Caerostris extrusa]
MHKVLWQNKHIAGCLFATDSMKPILRNSNKYSRAIFFNSGFTMFFVTDRRHAFIRMYCRNPKPLPKPKSPPKALPSNQAPLPERDLDAKTPLPKNNELFKNNGRTILICVAP